MAAWKWNEIFSFDNKRQAEDLVAYRKRGASKEYPVLHKIVKTNKGYTVYERLTAAWNKYR